MGIKITVSEKAKEQMKNVKAPDSVINNIAKILIETY